jgi:hypothetical protein
LYSIQQQQQQQQINCKLIQTFPQEHSSYWITCLLQVNPNTLVSSSYSDSSSPTDNSIVIWSKSKSSSLYEPIQRITHKETGRGGIERLVLINQKKEEEEELFASCSSLDGLIIIWRRGKGDKFQIKQKITNESGVERLLYISQTNELISGSNSSPSYLLQIWSTSPSSSSSSSSSSDFVERQKIETSSGIWSLCQLKENRNRIEFASGHYNGQIMIWSKQQQINASNYSLSKTLRPFNGDSHVNDIIFINNEEFNHFLISCCSYENKIVIYKGEEEEEKEELEHEEVLRLIPMSNGQFASGGLNQCLNIWSTSS